MFGEIFSLPSQLFPHLNFCWCLTEGILQLAETLHLLKTKCRIVFFLCRGLYHWEPNLFKEKCTNLKRVLKQILGIKVQEQHRILEHCTNRVIFYQLLLAQHEMLILVSRALSWQISSSKNYLTSIENLKASMYLLPFLQPQLYH